MKKFKFLFTFGLKKRIKTKSFLVSNIIVGLIIIGITLLPTIISQFQSDETPLEINDVVWVIDNSGQTSVTNLEQLFIEQFELNLLGETINSTEFIILPAGTTFNVDDFFNEIDVNGAIVIVSNPNGGLAARIYNNSLDDLTRFALINSAVELNRIIYNELNPGGLDINNAPIIIETNPDNDEGLLDALAMGIGPLLAVPLFILITFGIQFIGTDIIEEKSTKAIEVIIASVKPQTHFLSKISSVLAFLVIQLLLYVVYGAIGIGINSLLAPIGGGGDWAAILGPMLDLVLPTLLVALLSTIVGIILFLVLGAFIASLAINQEDYQQIQTPIMMILMIGYFVTIFSAQLGDTVVRILAYIPIISPILLPSAFLMGVIGWVDVVISLLILLGTAGAVIFFLAPAYRVSILSYDQSKITKRIINSFKQAKALKKPKQKL